MADLLTVATPQALLERARWIRSHPSRYEDHESLASHLELAAETISELRKCLE